MDKKALSKARAKRLKQARNMANLSQKDMCTEGTINFDTYRGWESARAGGLSLKGAQRVIERIQKEGVVCSIEWLMEGGGFSAYFVDKSTLKPEKNTVEEVNLILNEIYLFKKQFPEVIHCQISDDGLAPNYQVTDFVAGLKHEGSNLKKLLGQSCIVILNNGQTLTRCLKSGNEKNTFLLVCTNPDISLPNITIAIEDIDQIAPIGRYYKIHYPELLK